ncbi:MAG: cob(I)yrinic acid a,c-diamide adenosyltransferase [Parachlamydiaceae bacterium]|nr:cob(I)yrinic acid a,c-diamide adenosyltransferase [Parachlamydiaceae bacterium]
MKTKIYTRSGDKGETSLFTGQRIAKSDPYMEAIGTVDECNCSIGIAVALMGTQPQFVKVREQLEIVQHTLFDLGAALATPRTSASSSKVEKTRFDHEGTALLEQWIDDMDSKLPELHTFILPGGHACGAVLHLARSICRRAERLVLPVHKNADVSEHVLVYLNRLSDYLFVLSRYVNSLTHSAETSWDPHKSGHCEP